MEAKPTLPSFFPLPPAGSTDNGAEPLVKIAYQAWVKRLARRNALNFEMKKEGSLIKKRKIAWNATRFESRNTRFKRELISLLDFALHPEHKVILLLDFALNPVAKSIYPLDEVLHPVDEVLFPLLFSPDPSLKRPETRLFGLRQSDGAVEGDTRIGSPLEREENLLDQVLEGEVGLVVLRLPPPDGTDIIDNVRRRSRRPISPNAASSRASAIRQESLQR